MKKSLSNIGKLSPRKGTGKKPLTLNCSTCNTVFTTKSSTAYCSLKCNPKSGGYREGSGRAKCGYYKGIYCGSTYELCWVIYQIDHNIPFTRFVGVLEHQGTKYIPDFIQNGSIVEIKGYEDERLVDVKTKVAEANGYKVIVLRKEQLQHVFSYVSTTYTKNYQTLYDTYKPKYNYVCHGCNSEFTADRKRIKDKVYCSRECSCRTNQKMLHSNL